MQDVGKEDPGPCTGNPFLADDNCVISEKKRKALHRVHQAIACCAEVVQNVIRDEEKLQAGTKFKLQQKSDHLRRAASCLEEFLRSDDVPEEDATLVKKDIYDSVTCPEPAIVSSENVASDSVSAYKDAISAVDDLETIHNDVIASCDKLGLGVSMHNKNNEDLPRAHFFSPDAPDLSDVISLSDDELPLDASAGTSNDVSLSDVITDGDVIPLCEDLLKDVISLSDDLQSDINVGALGDRQAVADAPLPSFLDLYHSYSSVPFPPVSEISTSYPSMLSSSAATFPTSSSASNYAYSEAFKSTASTYAYSEAFKSTASTYAYTDAFKTTASTYNYTDVFKSSASTYNNADVLKTTTSSMAEHYASSCSRITQPPDKEDHFPTLTPSDSQAHRSSFSEIAGSANERQSASSLNKDCADPSLRWMRMPPEDSSRQYPLMMPFAAPHPCMPPMFTFQPWYSCYMFPPTQYP